MSDLKGNDLEAFEDFYAGVPDERDRESAEWGFICGQLYGEAKANDELVAALREIISVKHSMSRDWEGAGSYYQNLLQRAQEVAGKALAKAGFFRDAA